jgi:hypothetical protein
MAGAGNASLSEIQLIEKLADGYSTQSKTANQFWIALLISSIIALTGTGTISTTTKATEPAKMDTAHITNTITAPAAVTDTTFAAKTGAGPAKADAVPIKKKEKKLWKLPFSLGEVSSDNFHLICIILIITLLIAFSSAMLQAIRVRMLIQKCINRMDKDDQYIHGVHIQDYVDSILTPTYNRTGPISMFILGKFKGEGTPGKIAKKISYVLYKAFKYYSFLFIYFLPVFSIIKCITFLYKMDVPDWLQDASLFVQDYFVIPTLVVLGTVSIVILFSGDYSYMRNVKTRIES